MVFPKIPSNEAQRIHELYRYELLDTLYEEEFDAIVKLASYICDVPISLITLVDINRQWFKAKFGIDAKETERNVSFCGHAINDKEIFVVNDAINDERFFDNPLVIDNPNIRFYAGMPLTTPRGYSLGTLCVIDRVPRVLKPEQEYALKVLSNNIIKLFELRIQNKELNKVMSIQQKVMSVMAHDIRGPLQSLNITYELKSNGSLSPEEVEEFDVLVQMQLNNTIHLLNNIVDWGKLQMSNSKEIISNFNVHDLCNDCFGYILLSAKAKNNKLINAISPDLCIENSKQGLEFILRNLLGNANKFTSGGEISVSAYHENNMFYLKVKDTGMGMSEESQNSISKRTWNSYKLGTNKEKGSGTGLKLIFEYLENIGGEIHFNSKIGEGTEVTIVFKDV